MDINIILNPAVLRIAGDGQLESILGEVSVVKGAKKHNKMENPCFTVENNYIEVDPGDDKYQGSFLITFYADDYKSGNADIELLGQVVDMIKEIFDNNPFILDNYKNYYLGVRNISKAEYNNSFPNQHYMVVEVEYKVVKTT